MYIVTRKYLNNLNNNILLVYSLYTVLIALWYDPTPLTLFKPVPRCFNSLVLVPSECEFRSQFDRLNNLRNRTSIG